jgi:choline monooxygenase
LAEILADYDAAAPLERALTLPASWYTDARVHELEQRAVWGRAWHVVGRAEQVAAPGDFLTAEVVGEPIVVVRGADGTLRAFYNVCRHHAAAVVTAPCGSAERLRCPYHGWTYDLSGRLRGVPEGDGMLGLARDEHGLRPAAVAVWDRFVLVHLDPAAGPPAGAFPALAEQFAPLQLGALGFAERRVYELPCNWKVFVDNYLDGGYHVPHLHRGLGSILDHASYAIECFEGACLQAAPIDGAGGDPVTAAARSGSRALYYWIYPGFMINWYEGYLDTNLVIPLAVDRTRVVFDFYFADLAAGQAAARAHSIAVAERIQDEDHAICASVQRGLRSRAYGAGRLAPRREAGEHLFHRLLAADLRGAGGEVG